MVEAACIDDEALPENPYHKRDNYLHFSKGGEVNENATGNFWCREETSARSVN